MGVTVWSPGLSSIKLTEYDDVLEKLTEKFVVDNWVTEEFCDFLFHYAVTITGSRLEAIEDLQSDDASSLPTSLSPSDMAWAVTVLVNNESYWEWAYAEKMRKDKEKAEEIAAKNKDHADAHQEDLHRDKRPRSSPGEGDGAGDEMNTSMESAASEDSATAADEEEQPTKVRQRWTTTTKTKKNDFGFTKAGKGFLLRLTQIFKDIDKSIWDEVWASYWEKNKTSLTTKKVKRTKRQRATDDTELDEIWGDCGADVDCSAELEELLGGGSGSGGDMGDY